MDGMIMVKYLVLFSVLFCAHAAADNRTPAVLRPAAMANYDEAQKEQKVVMYATSWCPYCQQARNHFRQQGIPYTEYDIERDMEAKRRYQAFGGRGIPVIFVGKRRMNGFSVSGFNKIYQ
jgi:glutaredoxin